MCALPIITNINLKTSEGLLELQAASDAGHLQQRLNAYFEDEFNNPDALSSYEKLQAILNRKAVSANHLSIYNFDSDQRVGELAVTLAITNTINRINAMKLIPGWQRPGQQTIMENLFGKKSWDGFIYENPTNGTVEAFPTLIEIKSTMVSSREDVMTPNQLMNSRLEQYREHFQSPNTICAVFIMPYSSPGQGLQFDFKDATIKLNEVVAIGAMGCFCLLSFPRNNAGKTVMTLHCNIVNKSPRYESNGKIDSIDLGKLELAVF